jgi:hypothetical protein
MDALIQTAFTTVARDMRELVHAPLDEAPMLLEKEPPNWHWHVPLGFASLAAAGALLVAAAGVQETVQDRKHHHARRHNTKMHKKQQHAQSAPLRS